MMGKIIIFKTDPKKTPSERARFFRALYGYVDRSHHGRYRYERKGLLTGIPHIMPARSVIVVRKEDAEEIISFLQGHKAEIYARDMELVGKDLEKLKRKRSTS